MNVNDLETTIVAAREAYYNGDESPLSDEEYDALVDQLRELDPSNKLLKDVGAKPASAWKKVKHDCPMGSLDKVQNNTDWIVWWNKLGIGFNDTVVTEKLDGISIELQYEHGKFVRAITRGDGVTGEDITPNVKKMKSVPLQADVGTVSVRGEILLLNADWQKYMPDKKNPRNAASGTSKRLDGEGCEYLFVLCYDIIPTNRMRSADLDYLEILEELDKKGFTTPNYDLVPCQDVPMFVEEMFAKRSGLAYGIDGAVVRINNSRIFKDLGNLNLNPKGAVAYKPPPEMKATSIIGLTWQIGKTGRVTPVAELKPVDIGGVTISRVSLHTARMAVEMEAGPGAKVIISRRNDVIPTIEKVTTKTSLTAPTKCPVCNEKLDWDGEYLICVNQTCPNVLFSSIKKWTETLNILFWGDSFINCLINNKLVHELPDIYAMDWDKVTEFAGSGVAARAKKQLISKRLINMQTFITALNIRYCG